MSSFEVLSTMIAQLPEAMRPAMNQVGQMMKAMKDELTSHSADNQQQFDDVTGQIIQLAARTSLVETGINGINNLMTGVSARLDAVDKKIDILDKFLESSATLDNAPTIVGMRSRIEQVEMTLGSSASLANAPVILSITDQVTALQTIANDVVEELKKQSANMKSEFNDINMKMMSGSVGPVGPDVSNSSMQSDAVASICAAVAQAESRG